MPLVDPVTIAALGPPGPAAAADLAFHAAIADSAGNKLLQACNEVVHDVVLAMIQDKLARASDSRAQMAESLRRHRLVFAAIRARDATTAARLARKHQFDYYAPFLSPAELVRVEALRDWDDE